MFDLIRLGASGVEDEYEIAKSLRFNDDDSPYLTRDPSSATNRRTFTFSFWTKLGPTAATSGNACLFSVGGNSITQGFFELRFGAAGFRIRSNTGGGAGGGKYWATTAKYKDVSKWYHCVCAVDTTLGTATDRIKFYINGVRESDIIDSGDSYTDEPPEDFEFLVNNNQGHAIGYGKSSGGSVDGYADQLLAEWHFIDGSALTPDNFGKTKASTGEWIPIEYTGSHGTNGYYLSFGNSSALGTDDSSNSNNWSPNNFGTSSDHDNDSLTDTPTSNYCVLDCLDVGTGSVTNGGLETNSSSGSGNSNTFGTIGLKSGKWYCEAKLLGSVGVGAQFQISPKDHDSVSHDLDNSAWSSGTQQGKSYALHLQYGNGYHSSGGGTNVLDYVPDGSIGDIYMMAIDLDNNKIWWGKDGTWGNNGGTGNPATGANAAYTNVGTASGQTNETWCVSICDVNTHHVSINFGQQPFAHTPPTGFLPITTQNLPEPPIKDPSKYFNTILYTGNAANDRAITGVGFEPDLVYLKDRDTDTNAGRPYMFDKLRVDGSGNETRGLNTDTTSAEGDMSARFKSIDSDGFTVTGSDVDTNANGIKYVAWNWKESATAGFDIVSYTGTGNTPQTRAHSLGVAPEMMIVKSRSGTDGDEHWVVYHHKGNATPQDYFGRLNTDGAWEDNTIWNDTAPTSSVFTTANNAIINDNGDTYIAYLWASVEGYSKVGCYFGNGTQEGPFVYTGFKPAWVLVKNAENNSSYWNLHDSARDTYNPVNTVLYPNTNDDEEAYAIGTASSTNKNFFSNGFQIYSTHDPELNANNERYIYLAFAERPFKYANTR